jgi:glycosyltransferase involved in cell wall biosynthesis
LKKVLYISYDGLTDALGQSQVLPYVVGLSKLGYSFTLISCEKPGKWEKGRKQIEDICKEHQINWQPIVYHKKLPVISAMRNTSNIRKLAFKLHHQLNFSMVHCRSYISSMIGLELKRKKNIRFIFDMRGFYADERVDGKVWNLSNPVYRLVFNFFKSKEKAYVQFSDAIVSLTEAGKKIMEAWPTVKYHDKITVIPCSVDTDLFDPGKLDPEKLDRLKTEIDSPLVVGYYGSIGTWYMLNEMLEQFGSILKKYPTAKFLIVSNDIEGIDIEKILSEKRIDKNSVIITSCGRIDMPYYISITDVALFFIKPCFSKLASSPTKHGEIMSMGKPLITNSGVGDMDAIVHSTRSGYAIKAFNEQEYDAAADQIETLRKLDPVLIRQEGMKIYSLELAVKKYAGIYETVLGKKG